MSVPPAFARQAARRRHLDQGNLLRSLTHVINAVPDGVRSMRFQFAVDWPVLEEAMTRLRSLAG